MSNFFLSCQFNSFDTFSEAAKEWELDFIQLDRGQFQAKIAQLGDCQLTVSEGYLSRHLHQRGISPPGYYTFAIYGPTSATHRWRLLDCRANSIRIFPKDNVLDSVSPPGFHNLVVTVAESYLEKVALELGYSDFDQITRKGAVVDCSPLSIKVLQDAILSVIRYGESMHHHAVQPILKEYTKRNLVRFVLTALTTAQPMKYSKPHIKKHRILSRVLEYVEANLHEEISLLQLSQVAEVSERTLRYSFKDYFEVNPNKYLLNLRLNRIRAELSKVNGSGLKISDIANLHGLWHMGKFAADYFKLFDELPSATLKRQQMVISKTVSQQSYDNAAPNVHRNCEDP